MLIHFLQNVTLWYRNSFMIVKIATREDRSVLIRYLRKCLFFFIVSLCASGVFANNLTVDETVTVAELPKEARHTLALIKQGGPFPYAKDGSVFGNYEGLLPKQKRGYYHEFTVKTPRARNRGARRIVVGGDLVTSQEYYYTDNHYATFKRITE